MATQAKTARKILNIWKIEWQSLLDLTSQQRFQYFVDSLEKVCEFVKPIYTNLGLFEDHRVKRLMIEHGRDFVDCTLEIVKLLLQIQMKSLSFFIVQFKMKEWLG